MTSGTGPLSPDFNGIDPDLMKTFITALEHGRDVIAEQSERIRQLLTAAEVPATALRQVKEIEGWIDDELPGLRRRGATIQAGEDLTWLPGAGLLAYDEGKHLSPEEARKKGTDLAKRLMDIESVGSVPWFGRTSSEEYEKVLGQLAANKNDADYTAAFFAALGVKGTLGLPVLLRENLDSSRPQATLGPPRPDDEALRTVSQALGTAVTGGSRVPGFAKVMDAVRQPGQSGEDRFGASLLLSAGKFPTEWLAGAALAQGFSKSGKTSPGILYALGNNPAAARQAITALVGPYEKDPSKLKELLKNHNDHVHGPYDASGTDAFDDDAFGRLLAAASGAYDEEDGAHSKKSAAFAFTVMTTFDDLELGEEVRKHLAEIAGAYATEITEGANIGDANMIEDSALKPATSAFGTKSAFTLSPKDTYRFLKTFANSAKNLTPFDEGMGRFSQKVITDASATTRRTGNVEHMDRVFTALGNVRGFELAAVEKVQGNLDLLDKQRDDLLVFIRDTGVGVTSTLTATTMPLALGWLALSTGLSAEGAFGGDDETRMDRVNKEDDIATLGRQHTYAQILMANGFKPKVTPAQFQAAYPHGVAIADVHGNLRPFPELIKQGNKGLEAFEKWTVANGMGSEDDLSVGSLSDQMANAFESRNKRGRERGLAFDS
ncbi:hypothetical protein ACFY19_10965 [Streptosporangium saharense]|uniref:hypothetical protein n=1 Tax=Streptosporangium saharense TaxID=1706840 RepID=UPI00369EF387